MAHNTSSSFFNLFAVFALAALFLTLSSPVDAVHSSWSRSHARRSLEASKRERLSVVRKDLVSDIVSGVVSGPAAIVSDVVGPVLGEYTDLFE